MLTRRFATGALAALPTMRAFGRQPLWQTLPPTPTLPAGGHRGFAQVNGIKLWHAIFGQGDPVVFLHGGLANADYWGLQVPACARHYQVITMDSRGHGRSTRDGRPFGYDLMADDVIALLDHLKIQRTAIVGWSDGAILGLDLAIRYPNRVSRVFAFAANTDPSGVIGDVDKNPTFAAFIDRAGHEYAKLSPTPADYTAFVAAISKMWETQPNWTSTQFAAIKTPILVVDGDHDEAIKRPHTEQIAAQIRTAGLLMLPQTSHFSFLQDPDQFTWHVLHFLAQTPSS